MTMSPYKIKIIFSDRAMAVCISGMTGRLGSVSQAYLVGLLLDNHCESALLVPGSTILGESPLHGVELSDIHDLFFLQFAPFWYSSFREPSRSSESTVKCSNAEEFRMNYLFKSHRINSNAITNRSNRLLLTHRVSSTLNHTRRSIR